MKYGLKQEEIENICKIFNRYPIVEKVILYGSRAKGNYRTDSDIDLTLMGEALNLSTLLAIENELDDLLLPYKIDLSLFHNIENHDLVDHINRMGALFYKKG